MGSPCSLPKLPYVPMSPHVFLICSPYLLSLLTMFSSSSCKVLSPSIFAKMATNTLMASGVLLAVYIL